PPRCSKDCGTRRDCRSGPAPRNAGCRSASGRRNTRGEPMAEPGDDVTTRRRDGRLGRWLRRNRIRIAAGLTGLTGFFGTLAGTDTPTVETWVLATMIGVLTPLPVVLVEGTFRNAVERLFESPQKPAALPAAAAGGG